MSRLPPSKSESNITCPVYVGFIPTNGRPSYFFFSFLCFLITAAMLWNRDGKNCSNFTL